MKLLSAALLFVLACAAIAQPEPAGLRKEMERFYEKWDRAIENGSMRTLMSMLEPDFYQTDQQGKRTTIGGFEDMMSDIVRHDATSNTTVMHASHTIVMMPRCVRWLFGPRGQNKRSGAPKRPIHMNGLIPKKPKP